MLIADAIFSLEEGSVESKMVHPPALKQIPMHNLDLEDPIFDSLRQDYDEFDVWLEKRVRDGSPRWVYHKEGVESCLPRLARASLATVEPVEKVGMSHRNRSSHPKSRPRTG